MTVAKESRRGKYRVYPFIDDLFLTSAEEVEEELDLEYQSGSKRRGDLDRLFHGFIKALRKTINRDAECDGVPTYGPISYSKYIPETLAKSGDGTAIGVFYFLREIASFKDTEQRELIDGVYWRPVYRYSPTTYKKLQKEYNKRAKAIGTREIKSYKTFRDAIGKLREMRLVIVRRVFEPTTGNNAGERILVWEHADSKVVKALRNGEK